MNFRNLVIGFATLLIAVSSMAQTTPPIKESTKKDKKLFYLLEAKITEKNSFWNFWSKGKVIYNQKVIISQGTAASIKNISQVYYGGWKIPCETGIIMNVTIEPFKPFNGDLYLSGNVQVRALEDNSLDQKDKQFQWNVISDEAWLFAKLDPLPKTLKITTLKSKDGDCHMEITITPVDNKGVPLPPVELKKK